MENYENQWETTKNQRKTYGKPTETLRKPYGNATETLRTKLWETYGKLLQKMQKKKRKKPTDKDIEKRF